jgi:hypothetical protein
VGRTVGVSLVALLLGAPSPLPAQGPPDAVERFTPGSGQTSGQDAKYYPANILGLPDSSARDSVPSVDPVQILSLGLGGEIVLRFDRHPIIDRPGMDFTVFENAFRYRIGARERIYAEPAEIAVSRDGITFISYPYDSLTLAGCAGVTPTNGDRDPFDPELSGGNSFDLADLGIDSVRFVRIHDVTAIVRDNRAHPYWDPTLTGFDLDAVLSLHGAAAAAVPARIADETTLAVIGPNPSNSSTRVSLSLVKPSTVRGWLVDMRGNRAPVVPETSFVSGVQDITIDTEAYPNGDYLLVMEIDGRSLAPLALRVVR